MTRAARHPIMMIPPIRSSLRLSHVLAWAVLCLSPIGPAPSEAAVISYTYDPSLGTLPTAQGWLENHDASASITLAGGSLSVQSTLAGGQSWSLTGAPFLFTDPVVVEASLRVNASNYNSSFPRRAGYYLGIMDNTTLPVWTAITEQGVFFHYEAEVYSSFAPIALNDGQFHDFRMVADATGYDLFIDGNQVLDEPFRSGVWVNPNFIGFGDMSGSGVSNTDLGFFRVTIGVPEPGVALLVLAGVGIMTARRRPTRQGSRLSERDSCDCR